MGKITGERHLRRVSVFVQCVIGQVARFVVKRRESIILAAESLSVENIGGIVICQPRFRGKSFQQRSKVLTDGEIRGKHSGESGIGTGAENGSNGILDSDRASPDIIVHNRKTDRRSGIHCIKACPIVRSRILLDARRKVHNDIRSRSNDDVQVGSHLQSIVIVLTVQPFQQPGVVEKAPVASIIRINKELRELGRTVQHQMNIVVETVVSEYLVTPVNDRNDLVRAIGDGRHIRSGEIRRQAVVRSSFVQRVRVLHGRSHLRHPRQLLKAEGISGADVEGMVSPAFGRDEDRAIRASYAVNCQRGRVLKNRDAFNFMDVYV